MVCLRVPPALLNILRLQPGAQVGIAIESGRLVVELVQGDVRPRSFITRKSLENAVACVAASGGSTNAVLHLLAVAREADVPFTIDDIERVSRATPLIGDLKPGGRYVAPDMYAAGGMGILLRRLIEGGLAHGECPTVTGKTLAEVARMRGTSPEETMMDLVVEDGTRVGVIYFTQSDDNQRKQVREPWVAFGSDEEARLRFGHFLEDIRRWEQSPYASQVRTSANLYHLMRDSVPLSF